MTGTNERSAEALRRIAEWSREHVGDAAIEVARTGEHETTIVAFSPGGAPRRRTIRVPPEEVTRALVVRAWQPWRGWNALTPPPGVEPALLDRLLEDAIIVELVGARAPRR